MRESYELARGRQSKKTGLIKGIRSFEYYIKNERFKIFIATIVVLINSGANVIAPYILGRAVDDYMSVHNRTGLFYAVCILVGVYVISFVTNYYSIILMGKIGQRVLYQLRLVIFDKIQSLPLAFFRQNRSGDLISRINEDTEKVNLLFSQALVRMTANIFTVLGIGVFIVVLNPKLGVATLLLSAVALIITRILAPATERANKKSLDLRGEYAAEVQENLTNFKAIIALNKREYFIKQIREVNERVYRGLVKANILSSITIPLFNFIGYVTQLVILLYGVHLIIGGELSIGLLISFLAYANRFFEPLRILASMWVSVQSALAAWRRIVEILSLHSNIRRDKELLHDTRSSGALLEFKNVSFGYEDGSPILKNISFMVEPSKTVAIIGPTGGGKSTIARLATRLYDPDAGGVYINGANAKSYSSKEIAQLVGYILQEPILFSGSVGENIVYGHPDFSVYQKEKVAKMITQFELDDLLKSFNDGIDTLIDPSSEELSLGQRQLIAFMRALLRRPKLLILDEATANVDTVTEENLEKILQKMPHDSAKIVIAHRLNTIKSADEIIFISNGELQKPISFNEALDMINDTHRGT